MDVIWKPVSGFVGFYEVSSDGRVRSITRYKKELAQATGRGGYKTVYLCRNGYQKCAFVHRLVAMEFCENPYNKPFVNHKDESRTNNNASNLEWVTHKENCNYGTAIKRRVSNTDFSKRRVNNTNQIKSCSIPISQYDKMGNFIRNWPSAAECSRSLNICESGIRRVCLGQRKTTHGYIFREMKGEMTY